MDDVLPVMHRYIDGLRTHDVEAIGRTVCEDLQFVSQGRTLSKHEFLDMLRALYAAFPDWSYEHDEPFMRDGFVVIRWRQGGTHTGTLGLPGVDPVEPTGRRVDIPDQDFEYRVHADRIVAIRPEPVPGGMPRGMLEQLGVETPPW